MSEKEEEEFLIPEKRNKQFNIIEKIEAQMISYLKEKGYNLHRIYPIIPFVEEDEYMGAFFFFSTESEKEKARSSGIENEIKSYFLKELERHNYPYNLEEVEFGFDSHENVVNNFKGNYNYRFH